ncbi:MAG: MFS transporter [Erythrobacter sp.]
MSVSATAENSNAGISFGTPAYRAYVLGTLTLVYTLNFVDRILIGVIGRPIIDEFGLSNFQFGLLSGLGFALFYTILGIPIARLSERVSRVKIIGVCVILWSIATILCGFTIGFLTLLLARLAVGVGEAGCTPPANSLINDYFQRATRPAALSIYASGVVLGTVMAQLAGGYLINNFTWREAFIYVGAPGVFIGILVLLTIKESPRGYSDPPTQEQPARPDLRSVLAELARKRTFWVMSAGASMATFGGYGITSFKSLFIQYEYGYSPGDAAIQFLAPIAMAGAVGAPLAGFLTQYLSKKNAMAPIWVPAAGLAISAPFMVMAFWVNNVPLMLAAFMFQAVFQYFYLGAQYNITQSVVSLRVRATAIAILLFIINLIGYGFGPPIVGFVADVLTQQHIQLLGGSGLIDLSCNPSDAALQPELREVCRAAKAYGVKWASVAASSVFVLAGLLFFLSGKTYEKDMAGSSRIG